MRWWIKRFSLGLAVALLAGCVGNGPGLRVVGVQLERLQDTYYLDLRLDYQFSGAVLEALNNGVPITVLVESRVQRRRDWLWPEILAQHHLRYTLSHHVLSRQYLVREHASASQRSFPNLEAALASMRHIEAWPLIAEPQRTGLHYGVRVRLDLNALPAPLRLVAFFSPAWRIGSDWVEGPVAP